MLGTFLFPASLIPCRKQLSLKQCLSRELHRWSPCPQGSPCPCPPCLGVPVLEVCGDPPHRALCSCQWAEHLALGYFRHPQEEGTGQVPPWASRRKLLACRGLFRERLRDGVSSRRGPEASTPQKRTRSDLPEGSWGSALPGKGHRDHWHPQPNLWPQALGILFLSLAPLCPQAQRLILTSRSE